MVSVKFCKFEIKLKFIGYVFFAIIFYFPKVAPFFRMSRELATIMTQFDVVCICMLPIWKRSSLQQILSLFLQETESTVWNISIPLINKLKPSKQNRLRFPCVTRVPY